MTTTEPHADVQKEHDWLIGRASGDPHRLRPVVGTARDWPGEEGGQLHSDREAIPVPGSTTPTVGFR